MNASVRPTIRDLRPDEAQALGRLLVQVDSRLDGVPTPRQHLALFERQLKTCRSTVAFAAAAGQSLAWSMDSTDPDGNPFEITSYEYGAVGAGL